MRSFLLKKLVRDKISADMQGMGQQVVSRTLNDDEFVAELAKKLVEEAKEFDPADPKALNELADVLEVVEALGAEMGTDFEQLRKLQDERREKRGGFKTRTYVEKVTLADDDKWASYYAKEPEKYTEE